MPSDKATTAINAAVIIIGSYHVPASVAFGAMAGASLFVLGRKSHSAISKAWLFAVSFCGGLFGHESAEQLLNWVVPGDWLHINTFTAAAVFSALLVVVLQRIIVIAESWPPLRLPDKKE
ncbi:putative holin [Neisseria dentiae]|uniref:putative holin n=1 Tax=Neisseria dentiae TaxID=194197 RepID=UPI00359F7254